MIDDTPFSVRSDDLSGRRWRYRVPWGRVSLAVVLFLAGFILCIIGLAGMSMASGIAGAVCFFPGCYATITYLRLYRGQGITNPGMWLEVEDV